MIPTAPAEEWAAAVARLEDEVEHETQLGRTHWLQKYEYVSNALYEAGVGPGKAAVEAGKMEAGEEGCSWAQKTING